MGLVVEPYSFFLCYEIKDLDWAQKLIPDNFKLVKSKIFELDEPNYYCIFGVFNVHSSPFWGTRMEFYVIAENKETGLLTWVIIDYDTNTVSFDKKYGLSGGNTDTCILTTTYNEELIIDIRSTLNKRQLVLNSCIVNGVEKTLDKRLWLEGNLSVAYGRDISDNKGETFSLMFNPKEVKKALKIPMENVNIKSNTWFPGLFEKEPANVVCFPFAQHFLSDSPGHFSNIMNEEDLVEKVARLDLEEMSKYSGGDIKKLFKVGQLVFIILIVVLIILLIIK